MPSVPKRRAGMPRAGFDGWTPPPRDDGRAGRDPHRHGPGTPTCAGSCITSAASAERWPASPVSSIRSKFQWPVIVSSTTLVRQVEVDPPPDAPSDRRWGRAESVCGDTRPSLRRSRRLPRRLRLKLKLVTVAVNVAAAEVEPCASVREISG